MHLPLGFHISSVEAHLNGTATYGHYMLDQGDQCRLFAFDIDLEKSKYSPDDIIVEHGGSFVVIPDMEWAVNKTEAEIAEQTLVVDCDPRLIWADRTAVAGRAWYKYQMSMLARKFAKVITKDLGIECAAAYSGNKGIHVYGFTGPMPAVEVRAAADYTLAVMDEWEPFRGKNFFKHKLQSPELGYPSFSVEVFPKQNSLEGKDLGNLMRLPLGKNLKSSDPTFFLDLTAPVAQLVPHRDPVSLLESGNPYL